MLYQTVRPQDLEGMIGNESTISGLRAMLASGCSVWPHTIIFHGPTGTGKTTLARILAHRFSGDNGHVVEVNAANTRGIDTVRDITSRATVKPLGGGNVVFILDESHQLTPAAQQGLLKVLEDCPDFCYFLFCTTSLENLITTIRNRCTKYQLGVLGDREMVGLLKSTLDKFDVTDLISDKVLRAIARGAEGSPRDALVTLEKIMFVEDEKQQLKLVQLEKGASDNVWRLCEMLMMAPELRRKKWREIMDVFVHLDEDSEMVRRAILSFFLKRLASGGDNGLSDEDAADLAGVMDVFSGSTFYGGKSLLGAKVAKVCLML